MKDVEVRRQPAKELSAQQIQKLAVERKNRFSERDALYDKYLSYYFGPERSRGGALTSRVIQNVDSRGRTLLRHIGDATQLQFRHFTNVIQPIIDDYQAVLGRVPRIRVPPRDPGSDAMFKAAQKQTRYAMSTMQLSRMDLQQAEAGFYLPLLGDAVYMLEVKVGENEAQGNRVAISSVCPRYAYPSFMPGFQRFTLYDLVLAYYEDREVLKRDYGWDPKGDNPEDALLITYISPYQRTVLVGKQVLHHVGYDLGFCPAEWVFNKISLTGASHSFANSEIGQVTSLQDFQNWARGVAADAAIYATYPIVHIQNLQAFAGDSLEVGPGSFLESVGPDGKVEMVGSSARPEEAMKMAQGAIEDIFRGAGTTAVRMQGEQHSAIQTGRAIHAGQGPQATRMDLKQAQLAFYLEMVFAKVFEMQERGPFLGGPFEMEGREKGADFKEQFDPATDIDGWYRMIATWDPMVGVNRQQRIMMAAQGLNFGLYDDLEAMDIAGVEDPLSMRQRNEEYHSWKAKMEQLAAGPQQGGPPPPGGAPGAGGGQPPPGPKQQMPFRPPEMAAPPPVGGVPQGVSHSAIEQALHEVSGRLKGSVFIAGEMAMKGQSMTPEIWVTKLADQKTVKGALLEIAPNAKIQFAAEEALPVEVVRVA